jgi:hypothetical protein
VENLEPSREGDSTKTPGTNKITGKVRPPSIALTAETIVSIQRELESIVSGEFFRSTVTGTRTTTKSMANYNAVQKFLTENNLIFFSFYTKAYKPVEVLSGI